MWHRCAHPDAVCDEDTKTRAIQSHPVPTPAEGVAQHTLERSLIAQENAFEI